MIPATERLEELYNSRIVLGILVWQQLILRYRRTLLGYLWSLLNPLLMMSVMAVVFAALFKVELKVFIVFLFTGMIPWNFFNASVTQCGVSLVQNEGIIKKIYLPKIIFPLSTCLSLFIDNILSFLSFFIIILCVSKSLSWSVVFIPIAYILLLLFTFGLSLIIAIGTVFFRDLQHLIIIAMQGLFFLTPIFYHRNTLSAKVDFLVNINPLTTFIDLFRVPLYHHHFPSGLLLFKSLVFSIVSLTIGLWFFFSQEQKVVFRL